MRAISSAIVGASCFLPLGTVRVQADPVEVDSIIASGLTLGTVGPLGHMNYTAGKFAPPGVPPIERHNFFLFDLADIDAPVISAKLKLYLPGPPLPPDVVGLLSPDLAETYRISGTPYDPMFFHDVFLGPGGVPDFDITLETVEMMFHTLGAAEDAYGSIDINADHVGTDVVIDINPIHTGSRRSTALWARSSLSADG